MNNDGFGFWNWITESLITPADILNFGTSLLAFVAAIVGLFAFRSWKKKIKYQKKFELAEEILANIYIAQGVINSMRFPASNKSEGKTREVGDGETPQQKEILDKAYIIKERYLNKSESFKNLASIRYRVKAFLGKEIEENLLVILFMPRSIFIKVDEYTESQLNPQHYSEDEKINIRRRYNEAVYRKILSDTEDSISLEVSNAVEFLEKECEKIIK